MELLGLLDTPIWVVLIVCCISLLYVYGKYPGTIWKGLGVPSPPSTPFIGHISQLYDPERGMCKTIAEWEKEYGQIFGVLFFRKPALVVTDLEALKEIFVKNFNNFTDRYVTGGDSLLQPEMKRTILFSKGKDWKRIRQIMSSSFSSSKLKLLTHYMNKTAEQLVHVLLDHTESCSPVPARAVFSAFALDVVAGTAFGVELDSQKDLTNPFFLHAQNMTAPKKTVQILMAAAEVFPCMGFLLKMFKLGFIDQDDIQFFRQQFTKLISDKKKENQDQVDFLQLLLNAEASDEDDFEGSKKLTTEEIISQSIIFIFAGFETGASALQWLSYELAKNQDVQMKLREEIENVIGDKNTVGYEDCQKLVYTAAVINETLRMYPPLHMLTRLTNSATTVQGIPIPANSAVIIPIYNIGRDPELFEDSNTFNPDRFMDPTRPLNPIAFLPFGFGPRQCIGMRLAMMELKIALVHMLKAVSIEGVTPREVVIEDFSGFLIPKEPIKLSLKPRHG